MKLIDDYFNWLVSKVASNKQMQLYSQLLSSLFQTEFTWKMVLDENRAKDGKGLRNLFSKETNSEIGLQFATAPANVLEVLVALAMRIETDITFDPQYGDRSTMWFWEMISSLDLIEMTDDNFNQDYVDWIISRFLNREYERNGEGSLFTVSSPLDMRRTEIWYQMQYWLQEKMKGA